jgi:cytidyltransferase-like protein
LTSVEHSDLAPLREKVAMVDGCFDPLHDGHLRYFEEAAKLGLPVLCNMQADAYIEAAKRRPSLLGETQRAAVIGAIKWIDHVHICRTSTADVLDQLRPQLYVKGADWRERGLPEREREICARNNTKIVYLDTVLNSSTDLVERLIDRTNQLRSSSYVDTFEELVLGQQAFRPAAYDSHYFGGTWRDGQQTYSIESRRAIEGKNPQNIRDVFQPHRVLDVGCGPGALMLFLHELGVDVHGVDFSEAAKASAPPAIRDRIHTGSVTEVHDFGLEFDLVISRETLEHLTVRQVREAVTALARMTSKFLYVTTRFHPAPKSLLSVTDQPEVDPTHITLLDKDFLRALFVMEGLRTRKDLEQRLDWKNYGRVLVFEKVS